MPTPRACHSAKMERGPARPQTFKFDSLLCHRQSALEILGVSLIVSGFPGDPGMTSAEDSSPPRSVSIYPYDERTSDIPTHGRTRLPAPACWIALNILSQLAEPSLSNRIHRVPPLPFESTIPNCMPLKLVSLRQYFPFPDAAGMRVTHATSNVTGPRFFPVAGSEAASAVWWRAALG